MSSVKIGCCGFPIGRKNYSRHVTCVEVQQTFYHSPRLEVPTRWRHEAPEGFEFTIKAWQLITHAPQSPTYRRLKMAIPDEKADEREGLSLCSELWLFPIGDPFQDRSVGGDVTSWRLHGIGGNRYRYSDDDLSLLRRWVPKTGATYVMFNNLSMFQDGLRFKEIWVRGEDDGP